jgi:hypothetical protein
MESVAAPGGVMLSESTARLVEDAAVLGDSELVRPTCAPSPNALRAARSGWFWAVGPRGHSPTSECWTSWGRQG